MITSDWIADDLERRGVSFERLRHADVATANELAEREHVSGHRVAKVVIVLADDQPVELVLPASRHVDLERLCEVLPASQVRLASEQEVSSLFSEFETGAMPPLRSRPDLAVVMDTSMRVRGPIVFQAGTHRDAVRLDFGDWFRLVRPRVARFSALVTRPERSAEAHEAGRRVCQDPQELRHFLDDLLDVLHLQGKEVERLTAHMEQHTARLLEASVMPLVISELSALRARLGRE
jgi:Ala-tRNA(Pro) deacylase